MRLPLALIATAILLAASTASALTTFNVTATIHRNGTVPHGFFPLYPGDTLTLDIRLSGGTNVYGLAASVWGYDESVIDFVRGEAVSSINHAVSIPAVGAFSGLSNALVPAPPVPGPIGSGALSESAIGANGNRVQFMSGVGVSATNSNPLDPGLDGTAVDAQFRLVFTVLRGGSFVLNVGTGYPGDGEILAASVDTSANVALVYTVIPEPGTALLTGLGLAGFAAPRLSRKARGR